jgi:hypothetical protein
MSEVHLLMVLLGKILNKVRLLLVSDLLAVRLYFGF